MRLVADTNILFSYLWKGSLTRKILVSQGMELYSPEHALVEINRHKEEIMKKTQITEDEYRAALNDIAISVVFLPLEDYSAFLKKALSISPDPDDIDFFALCLRLDLPLWSNENMLKRQETVPIISTKELLDRILEYL